MKRKGLTWLLCGLMLLTTMTGCEMEGNTAAESGENENQQSVENENASNVQDAWGLYENGIQEYQYAAGEMKKYDETLHLDFGRNMDLNAENWLQMAEQGEPLENNRWIQYYREALNIECEYSLTNASLVDYNQELLLAMTSGQLPDVFHVFDQSMISQLAEAGAIWDMTEIYQMNANETLGGLIEGEGTEIYSTGMYDALVNLSAYFKAGFGYRCAVYSCG